MYINDTVHLKETAQNNRAVLKDPIRSVWWRVIIKGKILGEVTLLAWLAPEKINQSHFANEIQEAYPDSNIIRIELYPDEPV